MGKYVAAKIKNLRISLGLNQTEFADRMKVTQATVSRWEKGSMPDADKLAQLAEMSGESVRAFIDDKGIEAPSGVVLNRFWVRGEVAAGVWAAAYEWPQEQWTAYSGISEIAAVAGSRFGLEVKGESMNMLYPPGTVLDCINIFTNELAPRNGQRVIVERISVDGSVEATVKEYVVTDDGVEWLVPRSNNPAFQTPISASDPGEGIAEVRIVALVVGSYRPE